MTNKTLLRRKKKYRFNKTRKLIGGNSGKEEASNYIENKLSSLTSNAAEYLANKGARILGYEPINKSESELQVEEVKDLSNNFQKIQETVNKSTASLIEGVNNVLGSPEINETVSEAAEHTKEVANELINEINEPFKDPKFKQELAETLNNVGQVADLALTALDKPIDHAVDKLNESGTKMARAASTGAVKVASDVIAAVPGIGTIFDIARIVDDSSKAVASVVEAGSDVVQSGSELVSEASETVKNINEQINDASALKEQIREKMNIQNRINQSMNTFENPQQSVPIKGILKRGGKKTFRLLKKRKGKSKKLRFFL